MSTLAAAAVVRTNETQAGRPRLLFLCQTLPYPPDGGVNIRTYHVLRLLSRAFDITALCFYRAADRVSDADVRRGVEGLSALAEVEVFPIPQEHSRARYLADHLRSIATRRAYTVYALESRRFRARVAELLRTRRFALAHVDSLDLAAYLPALAPLPVVCVHHNVESALLRRRAEGERNPLRRLYLHHQSSLVEREERRWCGRVAVNVAVSSPDAKTLSSRAPGGRICVVPNGVDTRAFTPSRGDGGGILFMGSPAWYPNADGMLWFGASILPRLREDGVDAPVCWVGRAPEAMRGEYAARFGMEMAGYVDDVRPYLGAASCFVVPLRVGGGTRLKILDAWAAGKAVVSTRVGCEGLDARDGENILVRDEPGAFAAAVRDVLRDADLRRRLGRAGRRTAEAAYDWEAIGREMLPIYLQLLEMRR